MPQLDIAFFPTQVVWLAITFAFLYFVMAKVALPRITVVLESRQERIESNLGKAERLKREAEEALATYEKTMAEAREKAVATLKEVAETMARESEARQVALVEKLSQEGSAAEARIEKAKLDAIGNVNAMAREIVREVTTKLIGTPADEKTIDQAVSAAMKEPS